MSFLAPLFLLGAATVALPVIFHLIRRSSREKIPFSSLMFLMPTPPRVTRRSRLENILLLILRCLAVCLLAFAFSRPFFSRPIAPELGGQTGQKVLVLLDISASMRRGALWTEAKAKASSIFRNAARGDQIGCLTFDRTVKTVFGFEQWSGMPESDRGNLAAARLDGINPGWGSTRLGTALTTACELFEGSAKDEQAGKRIVLITDLQEGSRLEGLQGFEWPRGVTVTIEVLKSPQTSNAGLQLVNEREETTTPDQDAPIRARVSNSSDSKREQYQLGWRRHASPDFVGPTIDVYVPPGQNRVVQIARPKTDPDVDCLTVMGDDSDFDNTIYVMPPQAEKTRILFLGADQGTNAAQCLFYLRRAFQQTRSLKVEVEARTPNDALDAATLDGASLIVMGDALPESQIGSLQKAVTRGSCLLVPVSQLGIVPGLGRLLGQETLAASEAPGGSYAMLAQIDFTHPLFATFADSRYSDFTKIHFWRHRRIGLQAVPKVRVLARFDGGDIAVAEVPVGQGKVWIWAAGWQPDDSQLALSSKFVPLLYAMLEQSGGIKEQRSAYTVGDTVSLPISADSVTVREPDASEVRVTGDRFTGTDQPGVYSLTNGVAPFRFAVNLAPEESRTGPLPVEELERAGVPTAKPVPGNPREIQKRREHLQATELENRQKLWRWLIVSALVVLVMETWIAGRLTRRAVPVAQ